MVLGRLWVWGVRQPSCDVRKSGSQASDFCRMPIGAYSEQRGGEGSNQCHYPKGRFVFHVFYPPTRDGGWGHISAVASTRASRARVCVLIKSHRSPPKRKDKARTPKSLICTTSFPKISNLASSAGASALASGRFREKPPKAAYPGAKKMGSPRIYVRISEGRVFCAGALLPPPCFPEIHSTG